MKTTVRLQSSDYARASLRFISALLVGVAFPGQAAGLTTQQTEFFENKVRPVLVSSCYKCHSTQAEKIKGGLLMDSREGVLKGGDTGPAIVPGNAEKSLLVKAIHYEDPDLQMPPKGNKLPDEQIADLETWIKMGAPEIGRAHV